MRLLLVFVLFLFLNTVSTQDEGEIFLSTLGGELYSLDLVDCDYNFVGDMPVSSTDISFHPNGNLYAISSGGELYEIDVQAGTSILIYDFQVNATDFYTALTISAQGVFYASGLQGQLVAYDLDSNSGQFLGNIGFGAEGDLTFYRGELYMAATNDDIVRVNIQNPATSTVAIDGEVSGRIFGIVSYAASCDSISVYALTNNSATIYQVDLENNSLSLYCNIPLQVSGGASTFEFLGSDPIFIEQPVDATGFDCTTATGSIELDASGGVGELTFSLDGINYQSDPVFTGLELANYTVYVADEVGCVATFPISPNGGPVSILQDVTNTSCGFDNGSIRAMGSGGSPPYTFTINGTSVQDSLVSDQLEAGIYEIDLQDGNGCMASTSINIENSTGLAIASLDVTPAYCGQASGAINLTGVGGSEPYDISLNGMPLTDISQLQSVPAGNYRIEVIDNDGCTLSVEADVPGSPAVNVDIISSTAASCDETDGTANILLSGGTGDLQLFVDGRESTTTDLASDLGPGNHFFSVTDSLNCTDTLTLVIAASKCPVYIPNAFSPNLDGINDFFTPLSVAGSTTEVAYFRIFDRWGGLLFEKLNGQLGDREFRWDGTRLGKPLSAGTYLYQIRLIYPDGSVEEFAGSLELLR